MLASCARRGLSPTDRGHHTYAQATDEGFCVDLGESQWAVMGLVTFVAKASLAEYQRKVDVQTLTNANTMLFKILATPDR